VLSRRSRIAVALSIALGLLAPARASAHDPLEITTDAHIDASALNVHTTLALDTAARICLNAEAPARRLTAADFPALRQQFTGCARGFYALGSGGKPLALLSLSLSVSPEDDLEMRAAYARPKASPLSFDASGLKGLPPAAGIVLTVTGQRSFLGQKLLRPDDTRFERAITAQGEEIGTPPPPPPPRVSKSEQPDGDHRLVALFALASLVVTVAFVAWRRRR
jgi:hypothetical protein